MTFWLARRGVASRIETFLSDHERCEIYWVTYCVNPPPTEAFFATLGRIKKRGGHLKVICRHPLAARTEQIIEKKTLASLEKAGAEIRGIMHTLEALPDEADIDGAGDDDYGPIHAKFIAARDLLGDGEAADTRDLRRPAGDWIKFFQDDNHGSGSVVRKVRLRKSGV